MGSQSASAHSSVPARPLGMEASVPRARGARSRARAVAASVLVGLVLWRPLPAIAGAGAAWVLFLRRPLPVGAGAAWSCSCGDRCPYKAGAGAAWVLFLWRPLLV